MSDGYVYYVMDDFGQPVVHAMSLEPLPRRVSRGMEVVRMDQSVVRDFHDGKLNILHYLLALEGRPHFERLDDTPVVSDYDEMFRPIEVGDTGIVIRLDKMGSGRVEITEARIPYPRDSNVSVHVTGFCEPNRIHRIFRFNLGQIIKGDVVIGGLPVGSPERDFSLWGLRPGPKIDMTWCSEC